MTTHQARTLPEKTLKHILVGQNYISQEDWDLAENYTRDHEGTAANYLINRNIITRDLFGQAMAEYFELPYIDFDGYSLKKEYLEVIDRKIALEYRLVVVSCTDDAITFATDDPKEIDFLTLLAPYVGERAITIGYALSDAIDQALFSYRFPLDSVVATILSKEPEDAPEVLHAIFEEAVIRRVSDIHFEPQVKDVVVRFRVDGVLEEMLHIDHLLYEIIVNRIKVSSGLRIDEHSAAQDGALHYEMGDRAVDMRISVVPITSGEKIVIRILGEYVKGLALSEIGISENNQQVLLEAAEKPFGMILVTGPTGSGKTTTLYSLVKLLNRPGVNITTIEDPVEYKIPGVNQIQVNEQTGLTFAKGLRSIVRQDPYVILVGEIRDAETAEIAINAALSGHLVLSTFHSNDAATAIPRLLDMGVEPFLLASTLELVIGQRLVRTLRQDSRISRSYNKKDFKKQYPKLAPFMDEETITVYESSHEENFEQSPFEGRTALFEMLTISKDIEELTMKSPSSNDIWEQARKEGARSMFEDGIEKLRLGVTTPGELLRVVQPSKKHGKE